MANPTEPKIVNKAAQEEEDPRPAAEEEEDPRAAAEDEDTGAQVAPIVRLQEVSVTTGEEDEDALLDLKAKLYRFDKEGNQWKERGVGTVKLLKHKESGKVRLVMRQNKTLKICANHLVLPGMAVQEHHGNDKSCVWHATDFADGELKEEMFCIRFPSVENCRSFKDKIEEITESLENGGGENEAVVAAANLIQNLSVEGNDEGESTKAKEAPSSSEEKQNDTEKQEKSSSSEEKHNDTEKQEKSSSSEEKHNDTEKQEKSNDK